MRRGRDPHELMEELAVDGAWFDGVLKSLAAGSSRRGVVRALGSFGLSGLLAGRLGSFEAEAKKRRRPRGKGKRKRSRSAPMAAETAVRATSIVAGNALAA
jgi:hypothetical protein